jgi:hypothetical protein
MKILYWIDDSRDKRKLPSGAVKRQLEKELGVTLCPGEPISDRAVFEELLSKMNPKNTRGVIMDYQLTGLGEKMQLAFGTTWAAEIRAKHSSVPVIGISHCAEEKIPKFQLENFLAFFPRNKLTDANPEIDNLKALLNGYRDAYRAFKTQGKQPSGTELMVKLLTPPAEVMDLLRSAIPSSFRGPWDKETPHAAGRWIWHELQGRPGFLFDELGLATNLGLNLNGLQRVKSKFDAARYQGAFASDGRPRWWVAAIRSIFEYIIGRPVVGPVSNAREELLKAARVSKTERNGLLSRAHAHKTADEIPDCVAYRDDQREEDDRVQALFKDTYVDDRDANPPFGFEARRIFGPGKQK